MSVAGHRRIEGRCSLPRRARQARRRRILTGSPPVRLPRRVPPSVRPPSQPCEAPSVWLPPLSWAAPVSTCEREAPRF